MKKFLFVAAMLLGTLSVYAKNVVPVNTPCGKVGYIDTERTTLENTLKQAQAIAEVLCGGD